MTAVSKLTMARFRRWCVGLLASTLLCLWGSTIASAAAPPDAYAQVKAKYAELSALLYAPPSDARDQEIAALVTQNTDFDELTRRAFGEPCPVARCKDHWVDLSNVERDEVRALFEQVVTREWTGELARAFAFDVDIQKPVTHDRDLKIRVLARPKGGDPSTALELFFADSPSPPKLVDLEVARGRVSKNYYKQFDRALSTPTEGYRALVAKLKKRLEREAGVRDSGSAPKDAEVDAASPEPDEEPPPADPAVRAPAEPNPSPPAPAELPWGKMLLGGVFTLGIGVGLGRMLRKESKHAK